jgi:hypothetical protein
MHFNHKRAFAIINFKNADFAEKEYFDTNLLANYFDLHNFLVLKKN